MKRRGFISRTIIGAAFLLDPFKGFSKLSPKLCDFKVFEKKELRSMWNSCDLIMTSYDSNKMPIIWTSGNPEDIGIQSPGGYDLGIKVFTNFNEFINA